MKKSMLMIIVVVFALGIAGQAAAQVEFQTDDRKEDPKEDQTEGSYDKVKAAKKSRLGFSLGTPGSLNLVFAQDFAATTMTLSGGGLGTEEGSAYGFQAGFSLVRSKRTSNYRALNLIAGHTYVDGDEWTYGGLEGFFQWRAFFLAPGLTVGSGDFSNPQLSLQIGFVWAL